MKYFNKLLLSASLLMASLSTSLLADSFTFTYTFNDVYGAPGSFNGTLTGTQVGDSVTGYVTGVSVDSLYVNGNLIGGTIFNTSFNTSLGWLASGSAVVSFDRDLSDFLFINSDFGSGDTSYTGFAYLVNGSGSVGASAYDIVLSSYSYDAGDGVWSLVNTSAVPDGGSTVGLLGLALIGFAAMRRQLAAR